MLLTIINWDTYLSVCWWRRELECRCGHEYGAVVSIKVVQERSEGLVQAAVTGDVTVAGRLRGHPERHPALRGIADWTFLTAHAVAAAAQTGSPYDQRQLQDQFLTSRDVDVNLVKGLRKHTLTMILNSFASSKKKVLTKIFDCMQKLKTYHQSILHTDDVAAKYGWFDLWNPYGLSLPGITHARDDVVSTHWRQLLAEDLGPAVGLVDVFGNDGGFGHHNAGAGVLKFCIDTNVFTFTEATAVDFSVQWHLTIRNEHAGDFLLLHATCGRLRRYRMVRLKLIWRLQIKLKQHLL